MFLAKVSINRPVMITMLISVFIVFGLLAYFSLSLNLMPKADLPFITIQTVYPGSGSEEIETQISKRIEDAVSTVSKIDYIESYSMDNFSMVVIAFELDKDVDIAAQEVKQKVDGILSTLPEDSERPTIDKFDPGAQAIINLIFSGNLDARDLYEYADKELRDRFSQIEGVAQVEITGGQEREIQVELDDRIVFQDRISLSQLTQILAAQNLDMPGGQFQQRDQEYAVKLDGEVATVKALQDLDIPTWSGSRKLRQIAEVNDSGKEIRKRAVYFNNVNRIKQENVISIDITKTSEGNPVDIARTVLKQLPEIRAGLPQGTD
ncbi:MAG: efflux RND transporter permease subunit, partial [Candidatus Cloacimonetes bacterium]|nr:efflux RND transporter permease subunit [Candidatus Cloacimonadota bacterium]